MQSGFKSTLSIAALACVVAVPAQAQFLRIGPFDLEGDVFTELVYSTNVERDRPSETDLAREDYFIAVGLQLSSSANLSQHTEVELKTGLTIEEHFERPDLNNSSDPFGEFSLLTTTEFGRYTLLGNVSYLRESESSEDTFVPDGEGRAGRDENNQFLYGVGLMWERQSLSAEVNYQMKQERHDRAEFKDGDEDEERIDGGIAWQPAKRMELSFEVEFVDTEFLEKEGDDATSEENTYTALLNLTLLERPDLKYGFGYEKEETGGEGDWEQIHTLELNYELLDRETFQIKVFGSYKLEEDKDEPEDDIELTYGVDITHRITENLSHQLSLEQEPVSTLGSTADTEQNSIRYSLTQKSFLMRNMSFGFGWEHEENKPTDGTSPDETIMTYEATLDHVYRVTEQIAQQISYEFFYEDSDIEDETLDEHRVTLRYIYEL